ncbi:MAG: hypothetical protein JOZ30_00420 [Hyphomicrobiales bacterium]|nr:hypothetical protein [Hyphomicrobiales bacterium]
MARAQFWGGYDSWWGSEPRPWGGPRYQDEAMLRPGEVADLLRRRGWSILTPPSMSGRHYVANVRNGFGQRLFVVLDAYDGRILDARQIEERPNTNELAAIPGGYAASRPDEVIRPGVPPAVQATPAPKPYHPPNQAKRSVKSSPLESPKEKEGTLATAHPTITPPAVKHAVPEPTAPEGGSPPPAAATASPTPGSAPNVRQVYPSGAGSAEPALPAPKSAEAAPAASTAPAPPKAAPAAPAKPVLPADAGYE